MPREILPGTGRGTIRRMVEGHMRLIGAVKVVSNRACPSTPAYGGGPPPRAGEDL